MLSRKSEQKDLLHSLWGQRAGGVFFAWRTFCRYVYTFKYTDIDICINLYICMYIHIYLWCILCIRVYIYISSIGLNYCFSWGYILVARILFILAYCWLLPCCWDGNNSVVWWKLNLDDLSQGRRLILTPRGLRLVVAKTQGTSFSIFSMEISTQLPSQWSALQERRPDFLRGDFCRQRSQWTFASV